MRNPFRKAAPREPTVGPSTSTCYLVVVLNTEASPPCVKIAFTASEPNPTSMGNEANLVLEQMTAPTFHEASDRMERQIADPQWRLYYAWLLPFLARDPAKA